MAQRTLVPIVAVLLAIGTAAYFFLRADAVAPDVAGAGGHANVAQPGESGGTTLAEPPAETPAEGELDAGRESLASAARDASESRASRPGAKNATRRFGRVVDDSGRAISGARVVAADASYVPMFLLLSGDERMGQVQETHSGADGRFELHDLDPAKLRLAVRAAGFAPRDESDFGIGDGGRTEIELPDLVLERGAILSGRVVDADGRAVADAELRRLQSDRPGWALPGSGERLAVTDAAGRFRIDQIACGPWKIEVTHDEHPSKSFDGVSDKPSVDVGGLEFQLERGDAIRGLVRGAPAGETLRVQATEVRDGFGSFPERRRADVAEDGSFRLAGLRPGARYSVHAIESERADLGIFGGGASRSENVTAEAGANDVVLDYLPAASLRFQVVDAKTRAPLEELNVEAGIDWPRHLDDESGKPRTSFPGGFVEIDDLRIDEDSDRVQIKVAKTGYQEWKQDSIELAPGESRDLGVVALEPVPVVRVSVRDAGTRAPIAGARVELVPAREADASGAVHARFEISMDSGGNADLPEFQQPTTGRTDDSGVAVLTSLPGQKVDVSGTADGHARGELSGVLLPEKEDVELALELSKGGAVRLSVVDANGAPIARQRIAHRPPNEIAGGEMVMRFDGHGTRIVTDAEGVALVDFLQPGRHQFKLQSGGENPTFMADNAVIAIAGMPEVEEGWQETLVVEGQTSELQLVAPERAVVTGRILEGGVALVGAGLELEKKQEEGAGGLRGFAFPGMGGGARERTDGKGGYRIEDVEVGEYTLRISHPTRRMPAEYPLRIREGGETTFDVDLPISVVAGRVLDQEGKGVPGLTVKATRAAGGGRGGVQMRMLMVDSGGGSAVQVSDGSELGGESVVTDADGAYRLRGLMPDVELSIAVEGDDIEPAQSDKLTLRPDETKEHVDVHVSPGGRLRVSATAADGSPARMLLVQARRLENGAPSGRPSVSFLQDASTTLNGLKPGRYVVSVQHMGGPGASAEQENPADKEIDVRPGETAELAFELP